MNSTFHRFFLYCAGANFAILNRAPSDATKMVGVGGVIFFTGVLAVLSSGYALYTIFDSYILAIIFGLIWGFMIFNLDRFIVSSMRKSGSFIRQLMMALPRIIMAAILGIVISKPLELKIFEKEIDKQLLVIISRNKTKLQQDIKTRIDVQGSFYKQERDSLIGQQTKMREEMNQASLDLEKEIVGTSTETTTGKKGYGSNAKRKEVLKEMKIKQYNDFVALNQSKLDSFNGMLMAENKQFESELAAAAPVEDRYNGFAARIQALQELGAEYKILGVASLFITLLFILIEISPVLVKLIMPRGPYDYLLEIHEHYYQWKNKEDIQTRDIVSDAKLDMLSHEVNRIATNHMKK